MQWSKALLDRPYYSVALKRAKNLDKWRAGRWGKVHMSWEEINAFKDDALSERDRLVYWLLRVWRTHSPMHNEPTVPAIYDELLRRYVRDFNTKSAWKSAGEQQVAILKWRELDPTFHIDQLGMCDFYAVVNVSFFLKGLEAGGFLTSGEAAHIVSIVFEGEGYCIEGKATVKKGS